MVITRSLAEGSYAWMMLYATKSPQQAHFLCLKRASLTVPIIPKEPAEYPFWEQEWVCHRYVVNEQKPYCTADDLAWTEDDLEDLICFPSMPFIGVGMAGTDEQPKPCVDFLVYLPKPVRTDPGEARDPHAEEEKGGKKTYNYEEEEPDLPKGAHATHDDPGLRDADKPFAGLEAVPLHELPQHLANQVWEDLANMRRTFGAELEDVGDSFPPKLRGGVWTKKKKDLTADSVVVSPKAGLPSDFARLYKLPLLRSWAFVPHTKSGCHQNGLGTLTEDAVLLRPL